MACERRQRDFDSFSTEKRMKKECLIAVFNFIMSVFLGGEDRIRLLYRQRKRKFRLDYKDILHSESSQILYEVAQKCCGLYVLGKVRTLLDKALKGPYQIRDLRPDL